MAGETGAVIGEAADGDATAGVPTGDATADVGDAAGDAGTGGDATAVLTAGEATGEPTDGEAIGDVTAGGAATDGLAMGDETAGLMTGEVTGDETAGEETGLVTGTVDGLGEETADEVAVLAADVEGAAVGVFLPPPPPQAASTRRIAIASPAKTANRRRVFRRSIASLLARRANADGTGDTSDLRDRQTGPLFVLNRRL